MSVEIDGVNNIIKADTISEVTSANGVAIDGVTLKDSVVLTDTISEKTSANGVAIDSVTLKDGKVGIGTTSPSTDLHIKSTADNAPHLLLENFQNADTDDAPVIELYLNDQTTGGIGDDTDVGVIRFTGDEKDGGTKETYAEIRGVAHDPGQGTGNKGHLSFFVQSAGSLAETMTLDETVVKINSGSKITYGDGGSQSNLMADEWRITSDLAGNDGTIFTANWERNDTNFSLVGSGMTESSGAFTFPSTGIYLLYFRSRFQINGDLNNVKLGISMTTDNSNYSSITLASQNSQNSGVEVMSVNGAVVVDITNTTTHKIKLAYAGTSSAVTWYGSSTQMYTGITFLRLGDT